MSTKQSIRTLFESARSVLEIYGLDHQLTREEVEQQWPNITYRGVDILELLGDAEARFLRSDGQEVYLGYVQDKDLFVIGIDIFRGNRPQHRIVEFAVDEKGQIQRRNSTDYPAIFYPDGYKFVHRVNTTIVDLRLD